MTNKALYIGSELDLDIIKHFPFIDNFILVDNYNIKETKYDYYYEQNNLLNKICPCLFRKIGNISLIFINKLKSVAKI